MGFYVYIFLCGAIVQLAAAGDEADRMRLNIIEACAKEIGSSKEDISAVINKESGISHSAKCLLACIMKKFGLIGADGKLSVDGVKNAVATMHPGDTALSDKVDEIVNTCMSAADPGDSECEAVYKYCHCSNQVVWPQDIKTVA